MAVRRAKLEPRRTIRQLDVAQDTILTAAKLTAAQLISFALRYLEAFWHGDVFLYNGHSHFGHGPLEPTLYNAGNFNDRYQIMMVGSCISFNYYQKDFLELKTGGSKNLETIVNGLPSYVWGGGEVTARFVTGLISGKQPTYPELLESMRLDTPWGERGYDPMRVVDGEMDNTFSRASTPITVKALPPVY